MTSIDELMEFNYSSCHLNREFEDGTELFTDLFKQDNRYKEER